MINILDYKPEYRQFFEAYNMEWIQKYFTIEPTDQYVLENPEEAILMKGGKILFAEYNGSIIGAVALMKIRKLGFHELPLEEGIYQRANIKMGMELI